MDPLTLTGQILGFVAMALIVLSFQFKDNKKLFIIQVGSCVFFVLHFLFLGLGGDASAYSGMAQNVLGLIFRVIVLASSRYPKLKNPVAMSLIAAAMAIVAAVTYTGNIAELLPVVGNFVCLGGIWTGNANIIRITQLAGVSPCWLTYDIILFSISGILVETFNIASIVIYYIRRAVSKRRARSEAEAVNEQPVAETAAGQSETAEKLPDT